ncbi:MAG: hypothetical protein P8Y14_21065 [Anaerolineales bacterium]
MDNALEFFKDWWRYNQVKLLLLPEIQNLSRAATSGDGRAYENVDIQDDAHDLSTGRANSLLGFEHILPNYLRIDLFIGILKLADGIKEHPALLLPVFVNLDRNDRSGGFPVTTEDESVTLV